MKVKTLFVFLASVFFVGAALAQDIPLTNWTVPPYHASSASEGLTTMTDLTPGVPFVGITPCRLVDTRGNGFTGAYGPPNLAAGAPRTFDLNDDPFCPGIPAFVKAYSLNITVTTPAGPGFILIYPSGGSQPNVSTLNYVAGQTIANAAIVPAGADGGVTVVAGVSGTHLIIDINGYFPIVFNVGTAGLDLEGNVPGGAMAFIGNFDGSTEATFGIHGHVASDQFDTAAILGTTGFVGPNPANNYFAAGIRGEGRTGVIGISGNFLGGGDGVAGSIVEGAMGNEITYGALATSFGTDPSGGAPPWAVFGGGNIGATGTKHFLDPHPTNPKVAIGYISLEGPEAGTYFRGRARFQNGMARITVPEHFRVVTDPEGLTVQITPIGAMATVAVLKMDLNEIVVQASRNVEFSYLVQGVRASFKDVSPIRSSAEFMPRSADSRLPQWLSPVQRKLLIQNGTFREDGTVNRETAHELGWDKVWEARAQVRPAPAPTP
jgi:hypothetical protein